MFLEYEMNLKNSYSIENIQDSFCKNLNINIVTCGEFLAGKNYFTKRAELDSYLLIYTLSGEGSMFYEHKNYFLGANSLIIINCQNFQYYKSECDNWHFYFVHFNGVNIHNILLELLNFNFVYFNNFSKQNIERLLQKILKNDTYDNVLKNLNYEKYMFEIFALIYEEKNYLNKVYQKCGDLIAQAKKYIDENFLEDISLDLLCKKLSISKFYFIRLFKNFINISPYEYVIFLRLSYAKNLLLQTDISIEQISFKCKYENTSSFIRSFKKMFFVTPNKFRNIRNK